MAASNLVCPIPPAFYLCSPNVASSRDGMDNETGTESMVSHRRERARRRNRDEGTMAVSAQIWSLGFPWYPFGLLQTPGNIPHILLSSDPWVEVPT